MRNEFTTALDVEDGEITSTLLSGQDNPKETKPGFRAEIRAVRKAHIWLLLFSLFAGGSLRHPWVSTVIGIALVVLTYKAACGVSQQNLFQSPPLVSFVYSIFLKGILILSFMALLVWAGSSLISYLGPWKSARFLLEGGKAAAEGPFKDLRFSFLTIVNMVLLAPFYEECFFRGYLLNTYRVLGDRFAIVFSALLFALLHQILLNVFFTFLAGLIWGILTVRYNSVLPSFLSHMLNNSLVVLMQFADQSGESTSFLLSDALQLTRSLVSLQPWISLTAGAIFLGSAYLLYRICRRLWRQTWRQPPLAIDIYEAARVFFHWPLLFLAGTFMISLARWFDIWGGIFLKLAR